MWRDISSDRTFYISLFVPLAIALVIFLALCSLWLHVTRRRADDSPLMFKSDAFRSPINASITVSGIVIPLLVGCVAYLRINDVVPPKEFSTLVSSLLLLFLAVGLGLFNAYSLSTMGGKEDCVTITPKTHTYFIPGMVGQFVILILGLSLVIYFFLFAFRLPVAPKSSALGNASFEIVRPSLRTGMTRNQMVFRWGEPDSEKPGDRAGERELIYHTSRSEFVVVIRKGKIIRLTEREKGEQP